MTESSQRLSDARAAVPERYVRPVAAVADSAREVRAPRGCSSRLTTGGRPPPTLVQIPNNHLLSDTALLAGRSLLPGVMPGATE